MSLLAASLIIAVVGAVGGLINALMTGNAHPWPKEVAQGQSRVYLPGAVATTLVGAAAAVVSWGLYGPFAEQVIFGEASSEVAVSIRLSALASGIIIGFGGAKWLTNEVDKKLLRDAAMNVALKVDRQDLAARIATATPRGAFDISRG